MQKSYEGKSLLFLSVILILLNSEEEKFANTPLYSTDGQGMNAEVLVKYFNPCGSGTWLITEAEKQDNGDYLLYGYCHIHEWEWGYVLLSKLESIGVDEKEQEKILDTIHNTVHTN